MQPEIVNENKNHDIDKIYAEYGQNMPFSCESDSRITKWKQL